MESVDDDGTNTHAATTGVSPIKIANKNRNRAYRKKALKKKKDSTSNMKSNSVEPDAPMDNISSPVVNDSNSKPGKKARNKNTKQAPKKQTVLDPNTDQSIQTKTNDNSENVKVAVESKSNATKTGGNIEESREKPKPKSKRKPKKKSPQDITVNHEQNKSKPPPPKAEVNEDNMITENSEIQNESLAKTKKRSKQKKKQETKQHDEPESEKTMKQVQAEGIIPEGHPWKFNFEFLSQDVETNRDSDQNEMSKKSEKQMTQKEKQKAKQKVKKEKKQQQKQQKQQQQQQQPKQSTSQEQITKRKKNNKREKNKEIKAIKPTQAKETSQDEKENKPKSQGKKSRAMYDEYWDLSTCLSHYQNSDPNLIRGKIRFMPGCGGWTNRKEVIAFVPCDRGSLKSDVVIRSSKDGNRAINGDLVYVLLDEESKESEKDEVVDIIEDMENLKMDHDDIDTSKVQDESGDDIDSENELKITNLDDESESMSDSEVEDTATTWREDNHQRRLWDPKYNTKRPVPNILDKASADSNNKEKRISGKVVCVVPPSGPNTAPSTESHSSIAGVRVIVGSLQEMGNSSNRVMFVPNNRSLPKFVTPNGFKFPKEDQRNEERNQLGQNGMKPDDGEEFFSSKVMYSACYKYGTWTPRIVFPPCYKIKRIGNVYDVEVETLALLEENGVNHGDFTPDVLKDVDHAVKSGTFINKLPSTRANSKPDLSWKPTPEMYKGRRDYTSKRIFTIDPTTAKDLDDALHITPLPNNRVEVGVHIADVSHFVIPDTAVDTEAQRRGTTVYLVDKTVPMLPRPLCEIACSLNENVERLAFSCVWTMNMDGTLAGENEKDREVWYGKTVIKSCARLDYRTAQNIIEGKVGNGEEHIDEELWPVMRRPTGVHTIDEVCADVRLMNKVAIARRKLRFDNGALALNGVKLTFQFEDDRSSPKLCEPYPILDSNRLIEEYMLLANYLVAERLITHAGSLALLRSHPPPQTRRLETVVNAAQKFLGFNIDTSNSKRIQESLSRLSRRCNDELVLQCITEMLTLPMCPAVYFAAGAAEEEQWAHFALNIPYYTHFTSPIRRYPDVIVHRLLQATLEGEEAVEDFSLDHREIQCIAEHCNKKKMDSKKASDRSDRVFLALYLKKQPIRKALGVVLSVGEKTFTVFVPIIGFSQTLFLDDHEHIETSVLEEKSKLLLTLKDNKGFDWAKLKIKTFTKICVSCHCKTRPPIDVALRLVGPWRDES